MYILHFITNGFSEVQNINLRSSKMDKFFKTMITSEEAGEKKPDAGIFKYAFKKTGAKVPESLMIGDDTVEDIFGAQEVGMDQVLFDSEKKISLRSGHLRCERFD